MSLAIIETLGQDKDFGDFCHIPVSLLKLIGIDFVHVERPKWRQYLMRIYTLAVILSQLNCVYFIGKEICLLVAVGIPDITLLLRLISGFNYALFGTAKFVLCIWNFRGIKGIYDQLSDIYPKTVSKRRLYRVNQYFWPKWIQGILYFYFGAVTFIVVSPLVDSIISYVMDLQSEGYERAEFAYIKLYEIHYSFDHRHPLAYAVTYSIELMHAKFVVIFNVIADIWLLCYALQLCMHFEYLVRTLEAYEPDGRYASRDNQFLGQAIRQHQIVLDLCNRVNKSFGGLLVLLLMGIGSIICCAGVYAITQGVGRELLAYAAFLPTAIGQYFLICYYGQQVMDTSESVADAAYNHPWYNGSHSYKKSILIIIIRSQRKVQLTAKGQQTICLEAFKMVMGSTYRVFALVKQTMLD